MPEMEGKPFSFWIPAFKLNPKLFLRLGQHMTVAQLEVKECSYPKAARPFPCNLASEEALQSIPILLGAITPAKEELFPLLRKVAPSFLGKRLVHIPFKKQGAEYIQTTLGFALPQEALQWGRAL
jgi:hypothetical protein